MPAAAKNRDREKLEYLLYGVFRDSFLMLEI